MKQSKMLHPLLVCFLFVFPLLGQTQPQLITVDATAPSAPFPHFWEKMFGSGRAILSLRYTYQSDLRAAEPKPEIWGTPTATQRGYEDCRPREIVNKQSNTAIRC